MENIKHEEFCTQLTPEQDKQATSSLVSWLKDLLQRFSHFKGVKGEQQNDLFTNEGRDEEEQGDIAVLCAEIDQYHDYQKDYLSTRQSVKEQTGEFSSEDENEWIESKIDSMVKEFGAEGSEEEANMAKEAFRDAMEAVVEGRADRFEEELADVDVVESNEKGGAE